MMKSMTVASRFLVGILFDFVACENIENDLCNPDQYFLTNMHMDSRSLCISSL